MRMADARLGLRENGSQVALLLVTVVFIGAVVGVERSVLPLLAQLEFGLTSAPAAISFLIACGFAKAGANFLAGDLAGRVGRRRILIIAWGFGIPVPLLLMWAPSWGWIGFDNLLLGINQGLAWSTTQIMKIDLVGPRRRGLAMGMNRDMMARLQQMQEKALKAQAELYEQIVDGTAGGGAVAIKVTGALKVESLTIDPEVVDADDIEMLEDLVTAALNEALQKVQGLQTQQLSGLAGQFGINLPK